MSVRGTPAVDQLRAAAVALDAARAAAGDVHLAVARARAAGVPWEDIGALSGISGSGARARHTRAVAALRPLAPGPAPGDPLGAVREALKARTTADARVQEAVTQAREAGCTWGDIGAMAGITYEAAWSRWRGVRRQRTRLPPGAPCRQCGQPLPPGSQAIYCSLDCKATADRARRADRCTEVLHLLRYGTRLDEIASRLDTTIDAITRLVAREIAPTTHSDLTDIDLAALRRLTTADLDRRRDESIRRASETRAREIGAPASRRRRKSCG